MTSGRPGNNLKAGRTKSMYPRAPKHSSSNQRDTHYFCRCLALIIKQKRGRIKNSHRGKDKGDICMCNCLLEAKDAPGKETGMSLPFPCPQDNMEWDKKIQRARSLEGILSPLNGLGFVSSGIKELITEAVFLKWQPCPVRTSLLWYDSTHSDGTQPSANHCSSFQLWPSYNYTLKASVDLNELSSNQLSLFWIKSTRLSVCLITRIALWEMN